MSGHGKAPIAQSHQRQLSLKADEIQERSVDVKVDLEQNSISTTCINNDIKVDQEQDPSQRGGAHFGEHQLRGWFCLRYQVFSIGLMLDLII